MSKNRAGAPYVVLGIVFMVLGLTNSRAFLALGIVFLAIGLTRRR